MRPAKAAPRSTGYRSHGGSPDRPARSTGFKSHSAGAGKSREGYAPRDEAPRKPRAEGGAEGRPFVKRETGKGFAGKADGGKPAARSAGAKSHGPKPEGGKTFAARKPAAKPVDARDTSKRFTPPKRPRG